jgi:HPP family
MKALRKSVGPILLADGMAVVFMTIIAAAAHLTGIRLLIFPELAALSQDVLRRPTGQWATQPWRLILTPALTATVGLFVTRHVSYGAIAVLIVVSASILIIKLLRSSVAPAISAGVLPLVLGETRWGYPAAILAGLVALAIVLLLWKRFGPHVTPASPSEQSESKLVDELEAQPHDRWWVLTLLAFVLLLAIPAQLTGLRFLLFPPLVVMAYEIFGHPEAPAWMERPALFPLVCCLTALLGFGACRLVPSIEAGVALTMVGAIAILRIFRVHMPPALAVGILPFAMSDPNFWYPVSVTLGTIVLTLYALGYQRLRSQRRLQRAELLAARESS